MVLTQVIPEYSGYSTKRVNSSGIILGMGTANETMLQCNIFSHWLSPYPEWPLLIMDLQCHMACCHVDTKPSPKPFYHNNCNTNLQMQMHCKIDQFKSFMFQQAQNNTSDIWKVRCKWDKVASSSSLFTLRCTGALVLILPCGKSDLFILHSQLIPWLLMTWHCKEPQHQQPQYWPRSPRIFHPQHQKG